ncbi:MAG: hypothetical protein RQ754_14715 [Desulfuromonadales bacterium]|nr:hypothetical protein [Desulfuromonadales bacterium]
MAKQRDIESQVDQLIEQVNILTLRVFALEQNLKITGQVPEAEQPDLFTATSTASSTETTLGGKSFLPRIASVCFLLVIALALRTLTDSGLLDLQLGSLLGIFYASALIIASWGLYTKQSALAPVFNICGALLIFSVTLETSMHFEAFPKELAYILFAMAGIVLAVISHLHQVAAPILVGTLGMCLAGVALDFPNPSFHYLALLLWLANTLGFFASRIERCSWLRWLLLGITLTMIQTWGLRIGLASTRDEALGLLAPDWLLPMAAIIFFTLMSISLLGIIRSQGRKISKFDFSLPTVTVFYALLLGTYILKNAVGFHLLSALTALILFAIAFFLSRRQQHNAPGTNSFTLPGVILLSFSLPALLQNFFSALALLSFLALAIFHLSSRWQSGGMRITAYLLQIYVGSGLLINLAGHGPDTGIFIPALAAALCFITNIVQFRQCRSTPPSEEAQFFRLFDDQDRSAIAVLLSGLVSGYVFAMLIAHETLITVFPPNGINAYSTIQTVTINFAAATLMYVALSWRNRELRNVAILVMVIGGGKTFLIDLLTTQGLGLVISIFAFGVVVSYASFALTRWQKTTDNVQHSEHTKEKTQLAEKT